MSNETFKRGQVEWALWRAANFSRALVSKERPPIFATRIKRLLDADRELDADEVEAKAPFAFVPFGEGRGIESVFAPFNVFCLAVALDLLDVGFKQGEIVVVMRHLRPQLERWFPDLLSRPSLGDRQNRRASEHPELPVIQRDGRQDVADARVFVILNRVEMTEVLSLPKTKGKSNVPAFLEPEICEGVAGLESVLDKLLPHHRRTVIVIEIAAAAQIVTKFLKQAPRLLRGRPTLKR